MIGAWERRGDGLAPLPVFLARWARSLALALGVIAVSLVFGMAGYAGFERMGWVDAFENAAMILSGMGPVSGMHTQGGKLFAGAYAIYSGIVVIASTGVLLAPVLHRVVHRLHVEDESA
ncbi:MAG: hypothetical protein K1X35_11430 [Caulobacteraceae bacterium]|nr:hypothetical protein [Caulobacteraceae bacterium]